MENLPRKTYDCVYFSPHLDDVAFSCSANLISDVSAGKKVLVATVFSEGNDKPKGIAKFDQRKKEEEQAAKRGGYDYVLGKFHDIRKTKILSHNGLIWRKMNEHDLIDKVDEWFVSLINKVCPQKVYLPLGVGRHIDHRILHFVGHKTLSKNSSIETWYYEDRPYAFGDNAVEVRLLELNYNIDANTDSYIQNLFEAPHFIYMSQTKSKEFLEKRRAKYKNFVEEVEKISTKDSACHCTYITSKDLESIWEIVSSYESQLTAFVGSKEEFLEGNVKFANYIGREEEYVERYWHLGAWKK